MPNQNLIPTIHACIRACADPYEDRKNALCVIAHGAYPNGPVTPDFRITSPARAPARAGDWRGGSLRPLAYRPKPYLHPAGPSRALHLPPVSSPRRFVRSLAHLRIPAARLRTHYAQPAPDRRPPRSARRLVPACRPLRGDAARHGRCEVPRCFVLRAARPRARGLGTGRACAMSLPISAVRVPRALALRAKESTAPTPGRQSQPQARMV